MSKQIFESIGQTLANEQGVSSGQMFGKPCLKSGNKAFVAFFKDDMVFKLGSESIVQMNGKYPGATNWDPSGKGRPMKDWLQIPSEYSDDWKILAEQALHYLENTK